MRRVCFRFMAKMLLKATKLFGDCISFEIVTRARLCSSVTRLTRPRGQWGALLPRGGAFRVTFRGRGAPQGRPRTQKSARQRGKKYYDPFLTQGGFVRPRKRGALLPPGGEGFRVTFPRNYCKA